MKFTQKMLINTIKYLAALSKKCNKANFFKNWQKQGFLELIAVAKILKYTQY